MGAISNQRVHYYKDIIVWSVSVNENICNDKYEVDEAHLGLVGKAWKVWEEPRDELGGQTLGLAVALHARQNRSVLVLVLKTKRKSNNEFDSLMKTKQSIMFWDRKYEIRLRLYLK